jgi:hypothetical protein
MTSLIDALKADFTGRRRKVDLLGFEVWVTPMTSGEFARLNSMHLDDDALRNAEMIVRKCTDADGKPVFTKDDKMALKNEVAGDRLGPLIAAIVGSSVEDAEKN